MKTLKSITLFMTLLLALTTLSMAEDSKRKINRDADKTLTKFYKEVSGSKRYLERAKGYVVFTDVKEAGFFIGGRYGEGVLRVGGVSKAYYSITSASVGMQMGAQQYSLVIAFTTNAALNKFITDDDWDTDIDVNMAVIDWNAEEEADDVDFGTGAIGFILDSKGMMGNFTFEGTEFDRITPKD